MKWLITVSSFLPCIDSHLGCGWALLTQGNPACRPYVTEPCAEGTTAWLGTSSRGTGELRAQRHRCLGSQRLRCQGNGHRAFRHGRGAKLLSWRKRSGALTPARPFIAPGTPCATCASGSHATPAPGPPNLMLSDNSILSFWVFGGSHFRLQFQLLPLPSPHN